MGSAAVILGAFGAHALDDRLSERAMEVWMTANRYHFFHVLAIFGLEVGVVCGLRNTKKPLILWTLGLLLFSGSLYTYALSGIKLFALIAPIGGLILAFGWLFLLVVKGRP